MSPSRLADRAPALPDWFPHALGAALVVTVVGALTFAVVWMEAGRSQKEAEVSTQNLALLVAEQVSDLYARADALILTAVNYHRDARQYGRVERTRINAFLTEALYPLEKQRLKTLYFANQNSFFSGRPISARTASTGNSLSPPIRPARAFSSRRLPSRIASSRWRCLR